MVSRSSFSVSSNKKSLVLPREPLGVKSIYLFANSQAHSPVSVMHKLHLIFYFYLNLHLVLNKRISMPLMDSFVQTTGCCDFRLALHHPSSTNSSVHSWGHLTGMSSDCSNNLLIYTFSIPVTSSDLPFKRTCISENQFYLLSLFSRIVDKSGKVFAVWAIFTNNEYNSFILRNRISWRLKKLIYITNDTQEV